MLAVSILMLHTFALFFFFNDTATTEIYTLSLHDALPISLALQAAADHHAADAKGAPLRRLVGGDLRRRSEEHTSELQSPCNLVCRLLLEKKKCPHFVDVHVALQGGAFRMTFQHIAAVSNA